MQDINKSINSLHMQDIKNDKHSSYFFTTNEYSLLITRFFNLNADELVGISTPYIILKDNTSYKYNRDSDNFVYLSGNHVSICESVEEELVRSETLIMRYIEEIDKLEDDLYMRKLSPIFLDVWFDLKKDITRMERILERAYEALKIYGRDYCEQESFPQDSFINIIEHVERYQRLSALNSNKLDTLYSYYNSLKSDKMNKNVYALTILSGIFLPLNLVVGFFGMNTEKLFFGGNESGTLYVTMILVSLFLIFIAIIPLIEVLERLILRRLLGRFNLYNQLVENIKKISLFKSE